MKKVFITITLGLTFSATVFGQIKTNQSLSQNSITNQTPFLDASSSSLWNGTTNIGKGLVFPRVDLQALTTIAGPGRPGSDNAPTRYDGMVVYNIADNVAPGIGANETPIVKPGFYYYKNTSGKLQGGHWVRIKDASDVSAGVTGGDFWSLSGNTGITPVQLQDKDAGDYRVKNLNNANFIGSTNDANVAMVTKNIARLEIGVLDHEVAGTPFEFVLDVYGKARFRKGIVTEASTYPDYVFDNYFTGKSDVNPDYKFKKLNEVEAFIKENNHLPGVTKIDDLAKTESGYEVDNTKLSIQTLEKVEELYLHLIEQQKEIQALKAQIAELKK